MMLSNKFDGKPRTFLKWVRLVKEETVDIEREKKKLGVLRHKQHYKGGREPQFYMDNSVRRYYPSLIETHLSI